MDHINGTWKFVSATNEEESAELLGVPREEFEQMKKNRPLSVFQMEGKKLSYKSVSELFDKTFELGKEVVENQRDGSVVKIQWDFKDGKWKETQSYSNGIFLEQVRTVIGNKMEVDATVQKDGKKVSGKIVFART